MLAPPRPSEQAEREALIREARARQRRRRILFAGGVLAAAAIGLSVSAAIPDGRSGPGSADGQPAGSARGVAGGSRVPIVRVGTSGGVTWAINGVGMWLTTDGGRTWRASAPRDVRQMGDLIQRVDQVTFLDPRHGWLFADDVRLGPTGPRGAEFDRTSDGGRTWQRVIPKGCCGGFSFVNRRLGFFSGQRGLYETRNGGATWTLVHGPAYGGAPTFLDARHGVALLDGGLLRTADGGRHWQDVLLSGQPPAAGNKTVVWASIAVVGHRLVLTSERDFAAKMYPGDWRTVPYFSDDGGARWIPRPFPRWWVPYVGSNDGSLFSAADANHWFAAARDELAVTADAGKTWHLVRVRAVPERWIIGSIDFTSARVGWAIFSGPKQSVLMRTTDGGRHWTPAGPRRRHRHEAAR